MWGTKTYRLLTVLCLLPAPLLSLIENGEAVSTPVPAPFHKSRNKAVLPTTMMDSSDHLREERLTFFTIPPTIMRKKRRRTKIQRNGTEGVRRTTTSVMKTSDSPTVEYNFENGTTTTMGMDIVGNKTVKTRGDKLDPTIEEQDNFCPPIHERSRAVVQSTLPALILLLNIGVHVIAFVLLLYWWKTVYYEVGDPYVTISPYGYGPATTPTPIRRKSRIATKDADSFKLHTLNRSLLKYGE